MSLSFRHHTNPVGTEWRWKMDQPEMILQEALENHRNMIKQFKGNFSHSFPVSDAVGTGSKVFKTSIKNVLIICEVLGRRHEVYNIRKMGE